MLLLLCGVFTGGDWDTGLVVRLVVDGGGGGGICMTGNALRFILCEWEGILNAVDGGAWGSGVDRVCNTLPFCFARDVDDIAENADEHLPAHGSMEVLVTVAGAYERKSERLTMKRRVMCNVVRYK